MPVEAELYWYIQCDWDLQIIHRSYSRFCYKERKASCQFLTSWWYWMGPHSMGCEVCPKAGANLFSLTCKLLQGNKFSSNHWNNIVVNPSYGNIILDHQIKTCDGWVAGVPFLQETSQRRAQSATNLCKRHFNDLHVEVSHPSKHVNHVTQKPLVSMSPIPAIHVKIAPWERLKRVVWAKRLSLIWKFWKKTFSSTWALP